MHGGRLLLIRHDGRALTAVRSAPQSKDDARGRLEGAICPFARRLQASPDVDDGERAAMGVTEPDK